MDFCKKSFTKKPNQPKTFKNNFLLENHFAPSAIKHFNYFEQITSIS